VGVIMAEDPDGASEGFQSAVVQVLGADDETVGAGFVVAGGVVITCAHLIVLAGSGPDKSVRLRFPQADGAPVVDGRVLPEGWAAPDERDVAVVRPDRIPIGVTELSLGAAKRSRGHRVSSYGFGDRSVYGGRYGYGVAADFVPVEPKVGVLLELAEASTITQGFSGGPLISADTGAVIGMVTSLPPWDEFRDIIPEIAYATLAETLREIWPDLVVPDECPYVGLEMFTEAHAAWYKGRAEAVQKVLAAIDEHPGGLLVLGPSGAGKSSLMRAGVVPALARGELLGSDHWRTAVIRPGPDLLASLRPYLKDTASSEAAGTSQSGDKRSVVVIDQFEDLLRPSMSFGSDAVAREVVNEITAAIGRPGLCLVLVMRDDFYALLADQAGGLLEAIGGGLVNIQDRLTRENLQDIISKPAKAAGADLETGLLEIIITDVLAADPRSNADNQVSATLLPMLEITLYQLWQRRKNGLLTRQAYKYVGRLTGSLTLWCREALNALSASDRDVARRILTALVRPADLARGIPAARQQVRLADLRDLASEGVSSAEAASAYESADRVIATLTRNRIVTTGTVRSIAPSAESTLEPVAELVHDALIREWDVLREWVDLDHRFHDWRRRAEDQRERWNKHGHHPDDLLRGSDLSQGVEWLDQRRLPPGMADFVTVSRKRDQAKTRRTITTAGALVLFALAATGVAFARSADADHQHDLALSRQLAAQSQAIASTEPVTARRLATAAWRIAPTDEASDAITTLLAQPLGILVGHNDRVTGVAFSPNGTRLASASGDGTVRLWDPATGQQVGEPLTGHAGEVTSVVFSPNGARLASASGDGTVRLWDPATGQQVGEPLTGHAGEVTSVVFSPNGTRLASAGRDGTVRLWDPATGQQVGEPMTDHTGEVTGVAFSPEGPLLASASLDGTVRLWDSATGDAVGRPLRGGPGPVYGVAFDRDGTRLATAKSDRTVLIWNPATGQPVGGPLAHIETVDAVAFSPEGTLLASASRDGAVRLWDSAAGRPVGAPLTGHTDWVSAVAFSPDGTRLASASYDGTVRLWDPATSRPYGAPLIGHTERVSAVAYSPEGTRLASASYDGTVRLWDPATAQQVTEPIVGHTDAVVALAFSPDGKRLASASYDRSVRLWDPATGQQVGGPLTGHKDWVSAVAFSPDGTRLASASFDGTVILWDLASGRPIRAPLPGHHDVVSAVAFSRDGTKLASASLDGTVVLRNPATGWPIGAPLTGHTDWVLALAFNRDGTRLASASRDGTVWLWDPATGRSVGEPLRGHTDWVFSVAFSPDGVWLASAGRDRTVRLWDPITGRSVAALRGHTASVEGVTFSPGSTWAASASADRTVRVWYVTSPSLAFGDLCMRFGSPTRDEWSRFAPGEPQREICAYDP
jgi:WD40 repeat protein